MKTPTHWQGCSPEATSSNHNKWRYTPTSDLVSSLAVASLLVKDLMQKMVFLWGFFFSSINFNLILAFKLIPAFIFQKKVKQLNTLCSVTALIPAAAKKHTNNSDQSVMEPRCNIDHIITFPSVLCSSLWHFVYSEKTTTNYFLVACAVRDCCGSKMISNTRRVDCVPVTSLSNLHFPFNGSSGGGVRRE